MNIRRGDVFNARFPHASGNRGKKRPVLVVQDNAYNKRLHHAVVLQFTSNLDDKDDPACLFIAANSPEGQAAGLSLDSLASGYRLALMSEDRLVDQIGRLDEQTMKKIDRCLVAALALT